MTPIPSCQIKLFTHASIAMRQYGHVMRYNYRIGAYWADIYIHPYWVIEVDGPSHSRFVERAHDAKRTEYLESIGKAVLRVTNEDVRNDLKDTVNRVVSFVMPCPRWERHPDALRY